MKTTPDYRVRHLGQLDQSSADMKHLHIDNGRGDPSQPARQQAERQGAKSWTDWYRDFVENAGQNHSLPQRAALLHRQSTVPKSHIIIRPGHTVDRQATHLGQRKQNSLKEGRGLVDCLLHG